MQIYNNDFHHKGLSKSYSSYFSSNPDNRSKNEVSISKRKIRERENEHLKEKGEKLESPNESDISFKLEGKKQCSCRGTNLNCYKCDGTGFIEDNYDNPLLYEPIKSQKTEIHSSEKQLVLIKLSSKKLSQEVFNCPYCKMVYTKESSLNIHIENLHGRYSRINKIKTLTKLQKEEKQIRKKEKLIQKNLNKIECEYCNKKLNSENALKKHMNKKHLEKLETKEKVTKEFVPQRDSVKIAHKKYTIEDLANKGWIIK